MNKLQKSYKICRNIFYEYAKTYYLGAVLFEKEKFKHICAFYGFVRVIDNIVDCDKKTSLIRKKEILLDLETLFFTIFNENKDNTNYDNLTYLDNFSLKNNENIELFYKILPAVINSFSKIKISENCIRYFFTSMRMDLEKFSYNTYRELEEYMLGSAEIIGEVMFSIMDNKDQSVEMLDYAYSLGRAFQLTNFIRDIREDYEMKPSRIYIPIEDQDEFKVSLEFDIPKILNNTITKNQFSNVKKLVNYQIQQANKYYDFAQIGINRLDDRECIYLSKVLYSSIHNKIIENDYDVFKERCKLSFYEKIKITYNILSWYNLYKFIINYICYTYFF